MKILSKSCVLDPLPSCVIRRCADLLLPVILDIVNASLRLGHMPNALKSAIIPILKKPNADHLQLKNFRPISNLKAVSKIIEKSETAEVS